MVCLIRKKKPHVFSTEPESPSNLAKESTTSSSITVTWSAPSSQNYEGYKISRTDGSNPLQAETLEKGKTAYTFTGLESAKQYTIRLKTFQSGIDSDERSIQIYTSKSFLQAVYVVNPLGFI